MKGKIVFLYKIFPQFYNYIGGCLKIVKFEGFSWQKKCNSIGFYDIYEYTKFFVKIGQNIRFL